MSGGNGATDYYYDDYDADQQGEEEEEWDREQLLDPMWEKQQKKTFTAWCNSHLRKVGTQIESIEEDFRNGLKLMLLLEVISSEQLPKPDRGKMRFHKIANVNKALDFIESKGVKLVSIGAEEIVDGNVKMTLGLIWTIILRFAIQDISVEELTAKEGLLLWCQRKTAGYPNVNVQNFHMSWKDGLAFCALIHRHRPDLLDYSKLSRNNPLENLELAFDIAEKHLDIPRMLDPEDMLSSVKPDERSVMAYVSSYYHAFSGAQKAETAANRICKVLRVHQENEHLMEEYERLSSDLLEWLRRQIPKLEDRALGLDAGASDREALAVARRKLDDFRHYRLAEKPGKLAEKARCETTFNTLQTRLRLANRPAYMPTDGKLVSDIAREWRRLETAERGFEEWLVAEMERLERLDQLLRKFEHKCGAHDAWVANIEAELANSLQGIPTSLCDVRALRRRHEAIESELAAHHDRIDQICRIADELVALRYRDSAGVTARAHRIAEQCEQYIASAARRRAELDEAERTLENLDRLHLEFAKRAAPFHTWLEGTREDLEDEVMARSLEEVTSLQSAHDVFRATLGDAERELGELLRVEGELSQLVVFGQRVMGAAGVRNPYTNLTGNQLSQEWDIVRDLVPTRERALQLEMARQQSNDRLKRQFAQNANQVGPWLERQLEQVAAVGIGRNESLEDQLRKLKQSEQAAQAFRPHVEELERVNEALTEALVIPLELGRLTPYSTESLRVGWEQLLTNIARGVNAVENEILTRDAKGISTEQLDELRRSFLHFDRTRSRRLEATELRACLVSLGQAVQSDDEFRRVLATMDPNGLGYVTFDAFLDYMTREIAGEADSADRMVESFRVLAEGKPYITAEELRRELPPDQADYCVQRMRQYRGVGAPPSALDYTTFSLSLYGQADL